MSFADATIARLPRAMRPFAERHHELIKFAIVGATTNSYTVEITYTPSGRWLRCENRMRNCCDGTGSVTACP